MESSRLTRSFTSAQKGLPDGTFLALMRRWVGGMVGEIAHHRRAGHGQRGRPATCETNMKIRKGRFSGIIGNEVYVNSKYGPVVRSRPRGPGRQTPARLRAQRDMARVTGARRKELRSATSG